MLRQGGYHGPDDDGFGDGPVKKQEQKKARWHYTSGLFDLIRFDY